jgi:dynein assembly factor 3
MEDVVSSYLKKHPFEMEKLRDHRLRHHFAERYDTRKNAIDWDYQFSLKDIVKIHQS